MQQHTRACQGLPRRQLNARLFFSLLVSWLNTKLLECLRDTVSLVFRDSICCFTDSSGRIAVSASCAKIDEGDVDGAGVTLTNARLALLNALAVLHLTFTDVDATLMGQTPHRVVRMTVMVRTRLVAGMPM